MRAFLGWLASFRLRILLRTSFLFMAACAPKTSKASRPSRAGAR